MAQNLLTFMSEMTYIEADVTFFSKSEGGRNTLPTLSGCVYRPHIVVGDPNQKQAILNGNEIQESYLGVAFQAGDENAEFDKSFPAELALIYYPHPIYDSLVPDATFTIREGAAIVGSGKVKKLCIR
jgi:hypothetical protein